MADQPLTPDARDALRRLAYLDGDRSVVLAHLAQARERAARDAELEAERARLRQAEEEARVAAATRREREATLHDLQSHLKRTEGRLSSGQLSTEREVSAALSEMDQLRASIAEMEGAWLEAMDLEERLAGALPERRAQLQRVERAAVERQAIAAREAEAADARVREIDAERRLAAQRLSPAVRDRYRALFPRTAGHPFAFAVAGECGHCHQPLPGAAVQALRAHTAVPSCPSCGRLLIDQD